MNADTAFLRARADAFDALTAQFEAGLGAPALGDARVNAQRECRLLLLAGLRTLKDGAFNEALSRASLRSCALAAALGIRPPRFEPVYFGADYEDGRAAALFLCGKLHAGAREDFEKSRVILQNRILSEKPEEALKRQMAESCEALIAAYARACDELASAFAST